MPMGPAGRRFVLSIAVLTALSFSVGRADASPALTLHGTGDERTIEIVHATRREALKALYQGEGVTLAWHDEAAANAVIRGRYSGSLDAIARRLLEPCNYVAWYEATSGQRHIARIHVYASAHPAAVGQVLNATPRRVPAALRAEEEADDADGSSMPAAKRNSLPMQGARKPPPPPGPDPRIKGRP
jgi:hypothetical protein